MVGAALMRSQGLATLARVQRDLSEGGLPAQALVEGALILFAGALLLTPGLITDTVGFLCLVPPVRAGMARSLMARATVVTHSTSGPRPPGRGETLEGEFWREDD